MKAGVGGKLSLKAPKKGIHIAVPSKAAMLLAKREPGFIGNIKWTLELGPQGVWEANAVQRGKSLKANKKEIAWLVSYLNLRRYMK